MSTKILAPLLLLSLAACQSTQDTSNAKDSPSAAAAQVDVPTYYNIGVVHRTVTTDSEQAQLWFDRGLALTFGFNHEEAIVCFDKAAQADPNCAMAFWGKANAVGPNYNNPMMTPEACAAAHAASLSATAAMESCNEAERALIGAFTRATPPPTMRTGDLSMRPTPTLYSRSTRSTPMTRTSPRSTPRR